MRTLRDCFIFLLIMAALLVAWAMTGIESLRNPWSWILAVVGAAIFDGLNLLRVQEQASQEEFLRSTFTIKSYGYSRRTCAD